ncbi:threonine/homoserine/homoserine lactone efflux protein [Catenulispora sp. EB89]|uniref:hypothetical protein n=1 Tax=Catenulispora sp. EB89 TaxID=3156257 RepID=UPI003516B8C6
MLLAATGIGIGHAILPDHWMPLALLARTRNYPPRRTARLALAAAVTHVVVSVLLGTALAAVGLRFRETVARHADLAVGGVLVATAVALAVLEVAGRGHQHAHSCADEHEHELADLPAAATPHLPAQATRRSGRSAAVLERPIATPELEPHRGSPPLPSPAAHAATHAPRRSLLLGRAPRSENHAPRRSLLPGRAPRSEDHAPRRSLLPGRAPRSEDHAPRRSLLPGRAPRSEDHAPRRSLLPGRAPRSENHAPRRELPLSPDPANFATHPSRRRTLPTLPHTSPGSAPEPPHHRSLLTALAPFGAAASPDLTILPLFLTAGALGIGPALGVLAAFALATVAVMVGLTLAAATGARRLTAPWIEERATLLTVATLLVIGVLVVGGVL